jgi:16S rRNA (cytosine1402-N4)-methyltransferase
VSTGVHIPVMVDEVLEALRVVPGGRYCDGTVGGGGHVRHLLERSAPDGRVVGLDRDGTALDRARDTLAPFGSRVSLYHGDFADVVVLLSQAGMTPVDGLLLDLGISSFQVDTPQRGFSFAEDGPLDMRMDPSRGSTAAELIASLSEAELAGVIREYGEEPPSKRIARAIKQAHRGGELAGTADLARVVTKAVGGRRPRRHSRIHPATRTFLALRMAVNDEIGSLRRFLATFTEALRPGGRVAIIAFHSVEDRLVKEGLARLAHPCTCPPNLPVCGCGLQPTMAVVTRRPLRPGQQELDANPRARSARLRVAERL